MKLFVTSTNSAMLINEVCQIYAVRVEVSDNFTS